MLPSWRFAALGPLLVPEWVHQHEYPGFLSILQYSSHSLLAYSRSRWSLYTLLTPVLLRLLYPGCFFIYLLDCMGSLLVMGRGSR
ncbi:hypothetical protein BDW62DRAFT_182381 [Aspergillus aurantiobrunneus]